MGPPEEHEDSVQAERDDELEVVDVSKGHTVGGIVSVRLGPDDYDLLTRAAEARRTSLSETLRLGLRCLASQGPTPARDRPLSPHDATRAGAYSLSWSSGADAWARSNG